MAIELDQLTEVGGEPALAQEAPVESTPASEGQAEVLASPETVVQSDTSQAPEAQVALQEAEMEAKPAEQMVVVETVAPIPDPQLLEIEKILTGEKSKDKRLVELYKGMSASGKAEPFKAKGEEIARIFRAMIVEKKVDEAMIYEHISGWLDLLEGANDFYLLQEKKRKADQIVKFLREEMTESQENSI